MTPKHYEIELRILSHPNYLCIVRGAIAAAVDKFGFGEAEVGHVMLAVDEALANIIRHGYDGREDQPIWIFFSPLLSPEGRKGIIIVIEDEGRQVDPQPICSRDLSDVRPGGLGVHIIHEIMDDVRYAHRPSGGMQLTMHKWAPQTASHASPSGKSK